MSKYKLELEPNPTPNNPLVVLTTKIEELIEEEPFNLAMSALISAALRLEILRHDSDRCEAAKELARTLACIAGKSEN